MADPTQVHKPAKMSQTTWDYLIKFTIHHEGVVNHMYHNYPKGSSYQDISCGVGFLLATKDDVKKQTPSKATIDTYLSFFKQTSGIDATEEMFIADWKAAIPIMRVSHPQKGEIAEFAAKCVLRMREEKIKPKMAQILVKKLNDEIAGAHLKEVDYWGLPAVAQVGIASIAYGYSLTKMPNFCKALKDKNYEWAATEAQLSNMSAIKNRDHSLLFKDAAYINNERADDSAAYTYLPPKLSDWMPLYSIMGSGLSQAATP
jgi:hypothetical protein